MELKEVKLTKRVEKAFNRAEVVCQKAKSNCLMPEHLLIGCLDEGSTIMSEAMQKSGLDHKYLKNSYDPHAEEHLYGYYHPFSIPVCQSTKLVLERAISYMRSYNQIFLNEGHVLKALIKNGQTESLLTQEQNIILLSIATVSRDLSLDLTGYHKPAKLYGEIRSVRNEDAEKLILFINQEFGNRWTLSIKHALSQLNPSIFIAEDQEEDIVGFAAFDIHEAGYFGPMGVAKNKRAEGIGKSLLHRSLESMQKKGYKEIIIEEAGPIEFYEKACNAKVIPCY